MNSNDLIHKVGAQQAIMIKWQNGTLSKRFLDKIPLPDLWETKKACSSVELKRTLTEQINGIRCGFHGWERYFSELDRSRDDITLKVFILERMSGYASSFSEWQTLHQLIYHMSGSNNDSHRLKQKCLAKMAEYAKTFDHWQSVHHVAPKYSESEQKAFTKMSELEKSYNFSSYAQSMRDSGAEVIRWVLGALALFFILMATGMFKGMF